MSGTIKPDCINGMDGMASFLGWHMLKKKSEFCHANNDWVVFPVSLLLKMVNSMQNAGKVLSITLNI